jgi:hypothetical protein
MSILVILIYKMPRFSSRTFIQQELLFAEFLAFPLSYLLGGAVSLSPQFELMSLLILLVS